MVRSPYRSFRAAIWVEICQSSTIYAFRFGEVTNDVTAGLNGSISPFVLYMKRDAYNDLSDEH